jgi:hypothetical protein
MRWIIVYIAHLCEYWALEKRLVGWLVGWLVYSCCPHLEHRASVKSFFSLQFLNLRHSVGLLGRVISRLEGSYLTQTQNKHKQTSMPRVGFKPPIPAFERAKTVHALDRAGTVIGEEMITGWYDHECRKRKHVPGHHKSHYVVFLGWIRAHTITSLCLTAGDIYPHLMLTYY